MHTCIIDLGGVVAGTGPEINQGEWLAYIGLEFVLTLS